MLKYKIPQIVTLTHIKDKDFKKRKLTDKKNGLTITCKTTFE